MTTQIHYDPTKIYQKQKIWNYSHERQSYIERNLTQITLLNQVFAKFASFKQNHTLDRIVHLINFLSKLIWTWFKS